MMGIFLIHILKSSICLALLYLCYRLLLGKETFHRFNRIALLSLPVLSCVIPFIEITMPGASDMPLPFISLEETMLMTDIHPEDVLIETPKHFPWNALILSVYAGGFLFLLVRHGWSICRMVCLLRTGRKEKIDKDITLYIHRKKVAPFSWMNRIAISEEDLEKNGKAILAHERAHIRNRHSWDLLLAQVCVFLQWFNPAAWLWMYDLKTVHEYEADEWVIRHDMDARSYQLSMIESVVGTRLFTMANSFNQSLLNKRITMMNKGRSHRWARLKYLFVLPVVGISIVAFAHPPVDVFSYSFLNSEGLPTTVEMKRTGAFTSSMKDSILVVVDEKMQGYGQSILESIPGDQILSVLTLHRESTVEEYGDKAKHGAIKITTKKTESTTPVKEKLIFQVVEEMPEFPGGMEECMKFIKQNTQYPLEAHRKGIHGRVLVSCVISDKGDIESPHIYRSVDPLLDAEALRVIQSMPKWKPGKQRGKPVNVMFMFPVAFNLQ